MEVLQARRAEPTCSMTLSAENEHKMLGLRVWRWEFYHMPFLVLASSGGLQGTHVPIHLQAKNSVSWCVKLVQIVHMGVERNNLNNCYRF